MSRLTHRWLASLVLSMALGASLAQSDSQPPSEAPSSPKITAACTSSPDGSQNCGLLISPSITSVVISTSDGSTWTDTYVGTSFSEYATLSAPTTITTTDTAGETVVAVILAAGAAWLAVPKPGVPLVGPPDEPPPTITSPPEQPTSSSEQETISTTSLSSTSSSAKPQGTDDAMGTLPPPNWQSIWQVPLISYDDNNIACGWSGDGDNPTIDKDIMSSKIDSFCQDKDGTVANQTITTTEYSNIGAGIVLNITAAQLISCDGKDPKESTIVKDDCGFFLNEALNGCDTDAAANHGGTVNNGCLNWYLQPVYNEGELVCNGELAGSTGFDRADAMANIQNFCSIMDKSVSNSQVGNPMTFKPRTGNSDMHISVTYSDNPDCDQDPEATYVIDRNACQRFLYRTLDDCDTNFSGDLGKYGGNVTDECGVFSWDLQVSEQIACGGNSDGQYFVDPVDLNANSVAAGAEEYCNRSLTLDPNYQPDNHFYQYGAPGTSSDNYIDGDLVVRMFAEFNNQTLTNCATWRSFDTKGEDCRRRVETVFDRCGGQGGALVSNTVDGCVSWFVYGVKATG